MSDGVARDHVLVVCTANRCRSRMGEVLLAHHAAEAGWPAAISSGGTRADGAPLMDEVARVLRRRGLVAEWEAPSRPLTAELLDDVDLVLVMERAHLLAVADLSMHAAQRAFLWTDVASTDPELARRPDQPLREWVAERNAARPAASVLTLDTAGDVPDPTGRGGRAHRRTLRRLDDDAARLVELLAGLRTAPRPRA